MERVKTGWILFTLSTAMLTPVVVNPSYFFHLSGLPDLEAVSVTAWLFSAVVAIAYILYTFWAVPLVKAMQSEISVLKAIGIFAAIASGLMEEVVFRKLLMDWLDGLGVGAVIQAAASSLTFGIAHCSWAMLRRERGIVLPAVFSTAVLGLALAGLYLLGNRNVFPCILAHAVINMVVEPWLMLAAVSGRWHR